MARMRLGLSLLEVLVVLAIMALLIGLLLPAVQSVREAGVRTQSTNQLRQIVLANHAFAARYAEGFLPRHIVFGRSDMPETHGGATMFYSILPYIGVTATSAEIGNDSRLLNVRLFVSPADPSATDPERVGPHPYGLCSYPANAWAYAGLPRLPGTFTDGTSNTILLGERYTACSETLFMWVIPDMRDGPMQRRAAFADGGSIPNYPLWDDVYPVTSGSPPVTRSSVPDVTFQVRPRVLGECNPRLPQTPHRGGMLVGMADGSTRVIRPGVRNEVFWAAVTPAGGEVASLD